MGENRETLRWLWKQTRSLHIKIVLVAVCAAALSVSSVLYALACRAIIDAAIAREVRRAVVSALMLLVLILTQFLLRLFVNGSEERIRSGIGVLLRKDRLHVLMKKEYPAMQSIHSGEWMNRFFSDVSIIADGIATILPNLLSMVSKLVCAIAVLVVLEPVFVAVGVLGGMVLLVCTSAFRKQIKVLHKDVQRKQGRVQAFLQETIENFLIIRVFRGEAVAEEKCERFQQAHYQAQMKRRDLSILANAGISLTFQTGYLFSMCWGARGLYTGSMSYGTLTAILQLVGQIQSPIANMSGIMPKYYGVLASAERLMEIDRFADEPQQTEALTDAPEQIVFDRVAFSYGRTEVLREVSFQIRAGDIVALTGLSGGGKSTIFLLLLGIYPPQSGEIRIAAGGKTFAAGRQTRAMFTYVPQKNGLFSGTIRENLQMAKADATDAEMEQALHTACADEFFRALPDGLDTVLGERGVGISEGQQQRIAIARAVLSAAPVILLDEATSALDGQTESEVLENIAQLHSRTCFIVTHREAALRICNKQIVLEDGVTLRRDAPAMQ